MHPTILIFLQPFISFKSSLLKIFIKDHLTKCGTASCCISELVINFSTEKTTGAWTGDALTKFMVALCFLGFCSYDLAKRAALTQIKYKICFIFYIG